MEPVKIEIPAKSEKLAGLLFVPKFPSRQKFPSVVIFHGRGSNKGRYLTRAEGLGKAGFLTLVFDFRGCGESDGVLKDQTIAMGQEDALAAYDFLVKHKLCDTEKIGVWGSSFGGYQVALLTASRNVHSLLLSVPALYPDSAYYQVPETMASLKVFLKQTAKYDKTKAMSTLREYTGNLLVVENEKDELIPKALTKAYFEAAVKAKRKDFAVIPDAPHALRDPRLLKISADISVEWFRKTLD